MNKPQDVSGLFHTLAKVKADLKFTEHRTIIALSIIKNALKKDRGRAKFQGDTKDKGARALSSPFKAAGI